MFNTKMMTLIAAGALAACLALVGCGGGTQAASSSAASAASAASSAASAPAATESSAASAPAATEAPAATSAAAESASAAATSTTTTTTTTTQTTDSYIGENAALEAALSDAGLTANEVAELEVELDLDDAVVHYDVNFKQGGMEYDYDIDATTGAILNSTSEVDD